MEFVPSDEVRRIKAALDHPVIDSDGHAIEYLPLVRDILQEQAGDDAAAALDRTTGGAAAMRGLPPEQMRAAGMIRISWWGLPGAQHARPRHRAAPGAARGAASRRSASTTPSSTRRTGSVPRSRTTTTCDPRAVVRAFNTFYSEAFREHAELLTPVGIIPMHTPDEAIAELELRDRRSSG